MGYKLWSFEPREARCFIRGITFDETQMTIMCKNPKIDKEKAQLRWSLLALD